MCHVLKNVNQSYFALFVGTLKTLPQIWLKKICSLGTFVIALVKELLTLILKFKHFYRLIIFLSPVEESLKKGLGLWDGEQKIPELAMGNGKILWLGSFNFEWRLLLVEVERAGQYLITWHDIPPLE